MNLKDNLKHQNEKVSSNSKIDFNQSEATNQPVSAQQYTKQSKEYHSKKSYKKLLQNLDKNSEPLSKLLSEVFSKNNWLC